ncbi:MAG: hypothetical protein ACTSWA_07750 [Candidatus Thorarchaeota archaeon]
MTKYRKIFSEPLVRVKISRLRFPKSCPVCGEPTTTTTLITTSPKKKRYLRPQWDPAFSSQSRKRLGLSLPQKKTFPIPVCESHETSDDGEWRLRGIVSLFVAVIASSLIFVFMFAGSDIWNGYGIRPWVPGYFLVLAFSIIIGYLAFRPSLLECAVKIIGFDFDVQYVWLYLKDPKYRRNFISENEMTAELVSWIVKV